MIRWLWGETEFEVDPRAAASLELQQLDPGTFLLRRGEAVETFHCVREGDVIHLNWRGATYRLEDLGEGRRAAHRQTSGGLEAPMPGKVIAVRKQAGDSVVKGEEILIVEAMKMENAIRAPRDARVKLITAKLGDMVAPGAVLVELE
jgi:acetyl/propionyl-CoA carboxylase alpha subunit